LIQSSHLPNDEVVFYNSFLSHFTNLGLYVFVDYLEIHRRKTADRQSCCTLVDCLLSSGNLRHINYRCDRIYSSAEKTHKVVVQKLCIEQNSCLTELSCCVFFIKYAPNLLLLRQHFYFLNFIYDTLRCYKQLLMVMSCR
jgi:hypothetical protein